MAVEAACSAIFVNKALPSPRGCTTFYACPLPLGFARHLYTDHRIGVSDHINVCQTTASGYLTYTRCNIPSAAPNCTNMSQCAPRDGIAKVKAAQESTTSSNRTDDPAVEVPAVIGLAPNPDKQMKGCTSCGKAKVFALFDGDNPTLSFVGLSISVYTSSLVLSAVMSSLHLSIPLSSPR